MNFKITKLILSGFVPLLLSAAVLPCTAESNAWDGTWKLNKAKSQLNGVTLTITILSKGEFQIVTKSYNYKLICDGKYRPAFGGRNLACVKATAFTMDTAEKENGRMLNMMHRELSSDGKNLTQTVVAIDEHGSKKTTRRVFVRSSKSTGLAGAWKDADALDRQPQVMVTALTGSTLHLSFPVEKEYTDIKLDGTDAPTHGAFNGARVTLSVKPESSQRLLTIQKLDGKTVNEGALVLSSDGQRITEETWSPASPATKSRLVYEKQ
jgi:hypothetical protein